MASEESIENNNVHSETTVIDPSSELYLHHSDNPNQVLVTRVLDGSNYGHWRRSMEVALIAKNKLGFVQDTCKKPDGNPQLTAQWDRCNNMVISWLLHAVTKDISETILFSSTASQIWKELCERFGQTNGTRIFQVQRDLFSISQADLSITAYYTNIKRLWDEYDSMISIPNCSCGSAAAIVKFVQEQKLMQFLAGLNDDYKLVRGNLLMMQHLPSVSQAFYLILQEERQREINPMSQFNMQSAALLSNFNSSKHENRSSGPSFKPWNNKNYPTKGNQQERKLFFCDHCKMNGHTVNKCYKIHGYPLGHKFYKEKRVAANVSLDQDNNTKVADNIGVPKGEVSMLNSTAIPSLTPHQYNQLMTLLDKHTAEISISRDTYQGGANLAGSFVVLGLGWKSVISMRSTLTYGKGFKPFRPVFL